VRATALAFAEDQPSFARRQASYRTDTPSGSANTPKTVSATTARRAGYEATA